MKVFVRWRSFWIFLILTGVCCNVYAQKKDQNEDSLIFKARKIFSENPDIAFTMVRRAYQLANKNGNQNASLKSLNTIAIFYWQQHSYDISKNYAHRALSGAELLKIDSLQGDSWMILGINDADKGAFQQAIADHQKAAEFYLKSKIPVKLGIAYFNIGISESALSRYKEVIVYDLLAIKLLKDDKNISDCYNAIADCFVYLHDYPKAIAYNHRALFLRQRLKSNPLIGQSLNNLGFAFNEYGKIDSAIFYLSKSLDMKMHEKDSSKRIFVLQNLGSAWAKRGKYQKAENYINRSLLIAKNYNMPEETGRGNLDLAKLYLVQKKYDQALASAKITETITANWKLYDILRDAYSVEYKVFLQKGDYKSAVLYDSKRDKLRDSLFTVDRDRAISELEIQYQTTQKEKDIAALHLQNGLEKKINGQQQLSIIVLAIAAVLLALLFVIAYNNFRIKNEANKRIQTLMQDLHHRVKNNLQILSGLFTMQINNLSDENTKNALRENEARLTSMNLIHNKLYLDHTTTQIEMEEYLTNLLEHIKSSFSGDKESDINLRVDVDRVMLEADKAVAIGLLINELATNAFKYAFDDDEGEIYLGLKQESKSRLLLTLSDNGKGMIKSDKDKAPSFGLKLVNLMARQLNSTLVVSNEDGVAYRMEISI